MADVQRHIWVRTQGEGQDMAILEASEIERAEDGWSKIYIYEQNYTLYDGKLLTYSKLTEDQVEQIKTGFSNVEVLAGHELMITILREDNRNKDKIIADLVARVTALEGSGS